MLDADKHYLKYGRPSRKEGQDPYTSHFREHVLRGQPFVIDGQTLDSAIFAGIFAAIKDHYSTYAEENLPTRFFLTLTRRYWETRHPGESFFPGEPPAPGL